MGVIDAPYPRQTGASAEEHLLHRDLHQHIGIAEDLEGGLGIEFSSSGAERAAALVALAGSLGERSGVHAPRSGIELCQRLVVIRHRDHALLCLAHGCARRRAFDHTELAGLRSRYEQQAVAEDGLVAQARDGRGVVRLLVEDVTQQESNRRRELGRLRTQHGVERHREAPGRDPGQSPDEAGPAHRAKAQLPCTLEVAEQCGSAQVATGIPPIEVAGVQRSTRRVEGEGRAAEDELERVVVEVDRCALPCK